MYPYCTSFPCYYFRLVLVYCTGYSDWSPIYALSRSKTCSVVSTRQLLQSRNKSPAFFGRSQLAIFLFKYAVALFNCSSTRAMKRISPMAYSTTMFLLLLCYYLLHCVWYCFWWQWCNYDRFQGTSIAWKKFSWRWRYTFLLSLWLLFWTYFGYHTFSPTGNKKMKKHNPTS